MSVLKLLNTIGSTSSTKDKLKLVQDNPELKVIWAMALDKVTYTYGTKQLPQVTKHNSRINLNSALTLLKTLFVTRTVTGNEASSTLKTMLEDLSPSDAEVLCRVILRDPKCGVGRTMVNKAFPGLIIKPPYMRCAVFSKKTAKHISFPALLQVKADGSFNYTIVDNGEVTFISRQGEEKVLPQLAEHFQKMPDGVYVGELMVRGMDNRADANGALNSDYADTLNIYTTLWDYLTLEEYANGLSDRPYVQRFGKLSHILGDSQGPRIYLIETVQVDTISDALEQVSTWMARGEEGGVLKDTHLLFKDHTSNQQLKLKLEIDLDLRCTGFTEGTPGTKREATFGAMTFVSDDGMIIGQTSGFTDQELEHINKYREDYIGEIIVVQCNDLSKARDSDTYALMHPRFITFRQDKDETDTLERALELKQMAMSLGG